MRQRGKDDRSVDDTLADCAGGPQTSYDAFAAMYDRYWGNVTVDEFLPAYDRLLLDALPRRSMVLDLCCGTGQLAATLAERGHFVVGVDASLAMLRHARRNAPTAVLVAADARTFSVGGKCDAALSTFDSLNHVMRLEDLEAVFRNVRRALAPGGRFAFDLNLEEGYLARWGDSLGFVADDHACVVCTGYDPTRRIGTFDITMFQLAGVWRRSDLTLVQRPYAVEEVLGALRRSGFGEMAYFDAERDLDLDGSEGRAFFVCRRMDR
jgi:SAM-dependent methyltransferase